MQLRQVYVCFTFFGLLFWSFFRDIYRNVTLQHLRLQSEWMNDWESVKIKPMSHNRSLKNGLEDPERMSGRCRSEQPHLL